MSDKLEALSQPVGWTTQEELNEANGGVGWMFLSPMKQPDEIALYSQEYVTALLAALEEKDRIINKLTTDAAFAEVKQEEAEQQLSRTDSMLSESIAALKAAEEQIEQLKGAK